MKGQRLAGSDSATDGGGAVGFSARVAALGVFLFLLLCGVATWIPQENSDSIAPSQLERVFPAEVLHLLRSAGVTDVFHSGVAILILIGLLLNLLIGWARRIPMAIEAIRKPYPSPIAVSQLVGGRRGGRSESYVGFELNSGVSRELFREHVLKWAAARKIRLKAVRDDGGIKELQLSGRAGAWVEFALVIVLSAAIVGLVTAWWSDFKSYSGRVSIEEGARARSIEIVSRSVPSWPVLQTLRGDNSSAYREPGFEIEVTGISQSQGGTVDLRFLKGKENIGVATLSLGRPGTFNGLTFTLREIGRGLNPKHVVRVKEKGETQQQFGALLKGQWTELEGARFRILDWNEGKVERSEEESLGASILLEYQESSGAKWGASQKFWVFQNHPAYDSVRRRDSRFHFEYEGSAPRLSSVIRVTHDPAAVWVRGSLLVFSVAIMFYFLGSHRRYWFAWKPGKVAFAGSSDRALLFEPQFEASVGELRAQLAAIPVPAKAASARKSEVSPETH